MRWFGRRHAHSDQTRTAAALEAAGYMRWVETRQRRSATDEEVDLWIEGSLDRDGFALNAKEVKMITILELSMNIDLVHSFIVSTQFFDALDKAASVSESPQ